MVSFPFAESGTFSGRRFSNARVCCHQIHDVGVFLELDSPRLKNRLARRFDHLFGRTHGERWIVFYRTFYPFDLLMEFQRVESLRRFRNFWQVKVLSYGTYLAIRIRKPLSLYPLFQQLELGFGPLTSLLTDQ